MDKKELEMLQAYEKMTDEESQEFEAEGEQEYEELREEEVDPVHNEVIASTSADKTAIDLINELEKRLHLETENLGVIHAEAHYGSSEWLLVERLFADVVAESFKAGHDLAKRQRVS